MSWSDLNKRQQEYLQFSVIDQCKLTTTTFLYYLTYCILPRAILVRVLAPRRPDQVYPSFTTINKGRTLKFS